MKPNIWHVFQFWIGILANTCLVLYSIGKEINRRISTENWCVECDLRSLHIIYCAGFGMFVNIFFHYTFHFVLLRPFLIYFDLPTILQQKHTQFDIFVEEGELLSWLDYSHLCISHPVHFIKIRLHRILMHFCTPYFHQSLDWMADNMHNTEVSEIWQWVDCLSIAIQP